MQETFLVVTIDTEEDQWGPCDGETSVINSSSIPQLQSLFDRYGIIPTYLVSYAVASDAQASQTLARILNKGRCEIGTHLHPWNTPPVREEMTNRNSMLSNLPYDLQLEKIAFVTEFLLKRFELRPHCFRAGRWGLGTDTLKAIVSCGYIVDTSVTPFISWASYGGPSSVTTSIQPYLVDWIDGTLVKDMKNSLLEVPTTIGYSRWPFRRWCYLEKVIEKLPSYLHAKGLASQLNIFRKIWLSPEIEGAENMLLLSRILIKRGIRVLNMFFHSNSLVPGLNPFITTEADLKELYSRLTTYFGNLLGLADITPVGLSQVRELILKRQDKDS